MVLYPNVKFLVLIMYYGYKRCYLWGKPSEVYTRPLYMHLVPSLDFKIKN